MAPRQRAQLPRLDGRTLVALLPAQARDLAPDEGPIRDVVVLQGLRPGHARELLVPVQETAGEVGPPEPFEVHREEGDVGQHVAVAQQGVELQAVQDAGAVVEAEDVLGEQVAVPVADVPAVLALPEQILAAGQVPECVVFQIGDVLTAQDGGGEAVQSRQPTAPQAPQRRGLTGGRRRGGGLARRVERGDLAGQLAQVVVHGLPAPDQPGQPAVVRQPSHGHHGVAGLPIRAGDVAHAQVDVRGEALVELDLFVAGGPPRLQRTKVGEAQVLRLLHLVDVVGEEDQDGGVGLHESGGSHRPAAAFGGPTPTAGVTGAGVRTPAQARKRLVGPTRTCPHRPPPPPRRKVPKVPARVCLRSPRRDQCLCTAFWARRTVRPPGGTPMSSRSHGGEVVVGTDGSPHGDAALDWAAAEAYRRGARLHVVHAWRASPPPIPPLAPPPAVSGPDTDKSEGALRPRPRRRPDPRRLQRGTAGGLPAPGRRVPADGPDRHERRREPARGRKPRPQQDRGPPLGLGEPGSRGPRGLPGGGRAAADAPPAAPADRAGCRLAGHGRTAAVT